RTKYGEGRHVRAEKRKEKNELSDLTVREEKPFCFLFPLLVTKGKDSDVKNYCEIGEDNDGGYQAFASSSEVCCSTSVSRCEGQANVTSSHIRSEAAIEKQA